MDSQGKRRTQNSGPKSLFADYCSQRLLRFMGSEGILASPAMLLYINLKYRKVLNHIFDRQLFSAKKALRMKRRGKALFAIARSQPARH